MPAVLFLVVINLVRCMNSIQILDFSKSFKIQYLLQMVDSGLVVVVSIIFSMIVCVLVVLTYVKYEWCDVLFSNFTVSYIRNIKYQLESLITFYRYESVRPTYYNSSFPLIGFETVTH